MDNEKVGIKERIMNEAINIIAENGYYGTRTSEIARRANCSEGSIFKYYKNKEELLRSIVHQGSLLFVNDKALSTLEDLFESLKDEEPRMIIKAIVKDRLVLIRNNRNLIKIVLIELNFHDNLKKDYIDFIKENLFNYGNKVIDLLENKMSLKPVPREDLITFLFGTILGIIIRKNIMELDDSFDEDLVDSIADLFIRGIEN